MAEAKQYRKNHVVNKAMQWTGDNLHQVREWCGGSFVITAKGPAREASLWVAANDAWLPLEIGEWIIRDQLGFYPCKNEVFRRTYELETAPKTGAELVSVERTRQVDLYDAEHDAGHAGALIEAAICYGYAALQPQLFKNPPVGWPWSPESWKPSNDPQRNLAKSGALAAAAIDSLKRGV